MSAWKMLKKYAVWVAILLLVIVGLFIIGNVLHQEMQSGQLRTILKETFSPMILGLILAYLLNPMMTKAEQYLFLPWGIKFCKKEKSRKQWEKTARVLSVVGTMCLFLLVLIGGLWVVIPELYTSLLKVMNEIPGYYREIEEWMLTILEDHKKMSGYVMQLLKELYVHLLKYINTVILPNADEIVKGVTFGIIGGIKSFFNIVLAMIISVYVLFEKENLISCGKKLSYAYLSREHANTFIKGIRHVNRVFGGFVNGMLLDSMIVGILCYFFMVLMGLEYAVLISIIIGVTNLIPYFGPFIGAVPGIFLLLVTEPKQGLIFAIFLVVMQQIDGNIINPLILGESLELSGIWILFAILIGGGLFGIPGMILGAPAFACIYTLVRKDAKHRLEVKRLPTDSTAYLEVESISDCEKIRYKHPST